MSLKKTKESKLLLSITSAICIINFSICSGIAPTQSKESSDSVVTVGINGSSADYICEEFADQVQIQKAIDSLPSAGGTVKILTGAYIKSNVEGIAIPSNTKIELSPGTIITFRKNVGDGAVIFKNADEAKGNENISIVGGVLDGRKTNQNSATWQTAIKFTKVSNSKVECFIRNFRGWNIKEIDPGVGNTFINREYPNSFKVKDNIRKKIENLWQTLDDFESCCRKAIQGTAKYDINTKFRGTRSCKLVAEGSSSTVAVRKRFDSPLDIRNLFFSIHVRCANARDLNNVCIRFMCPNWSNSFVYFKSHPCRAISNKWIFVDFGYPHQVLGSPDPTNCQLVDISFGPNTNAEYPLTVWIDHFCIAEPLLDESLFILRFDDQHIGQYENAMPIMDKYGYPGVAVVNENGVTGSSKTLNLEQLKEMQVRGWDVINHTQSHAYLDRTTPAEAEDEIRSNQDWLYSNGFKKGSRFFAYPFHRCNEAAFEVIEKYHCLAQDGFAHGSPLPCGDPLLLAIDRSFYKDTPIPSVKKIRNLKEKRILITFLFHRVSTSEERLSIAAADFQQLIDNLHTAEVLVQKSLLFPMSMTNISLLPEVVEEQ